MDKKEKEAIEKRELLDEFKKNNCKEMWLPTYNLEEADLCYILDDCDRRRINLEDRSEEITELEASFIAMVSEWN